MKVAVEGGEPIELASIGVEPDWSRTQPQRIVYRVERSLFMIDSAGGDATYLAKSRSARNPAWSPVMDEIAVDGTIARTASGVLTPIPCRTPEGLACNIRGVTWGIAADTLWIAFAQDNRVLKVPNQGGTARVVIEGFGGVSDPAWSPDGRWIAFIQETLPPAVSRHIWLVQVDSPVREAVQLTTGVTSDRNPSWSPQSDTIYFDRDGSGIWKTALPDFPDAVATTSRSLPASQRDPGVGPVEFATPGAEPAQIVILETRTPEYPEAEVALGVSAKIHARLLVTPEGSVGDVVIVNVTTDPPDAPSHNFEQALIKALRQWKFEPLESGSAEWWFDFTIQFEPDSSSAK